MRRLLLALFALILFPVAGVHAAIIYQTALSGPAENPPNASPGIGTAIVEYDPLAHTLRVMATFSDLLGTTTAAHIHCCVDPPGNVGVATALPTFPGFPLGVTAGDYDELFDLTDPASFNAAFITASGGTVAGAEQALVAGLNAGQAYFNIHTSEVPSGEIRGFLAAVTSVPEPSALALLGMGLVLLVFVARPKQDKRNADRGRQPEGGRSLLAKGEEERSIGR